MEKLTFPRQNGQFLYFIYRIKNTSVSAGNLVVADPR